METRISLKSDNVTIEGMWRPASLKAAAIICHPHPLYGGNMDNPVVVTAADSYARKGIAALRFNFRGVGASSGSYDNGRGEQKDVTAAIDWLTQKGFTRIDLVGYSFGAWINALVAAESIAVTNLVMISPPVAFIDFPPKLALPPLRLVITGQQDDIAPPEMVRSYLKNWNTQAKLEIIPNADHFFSTALTDLASALSKNQIPHA